MRDIQAVTKSRDPIRLSPTLRTQTVIYRRRFDASPKRRVRQQKQSDRVWPSRYGNSQPRFTGNRRQIAAKPLD